MAARKRKSKLTPQQRAAAARERFHAEQKRIEAAKKGWETRHAKADDWVLERVTQLPFVYDRLSWRRMRQHLVDGQPKIEELIEKGMRMGLTRQFIMNNIFTPKLHNRAAAVRRAMK